ncbi:MAG: glycosyltransferase family 2 protein [Solobacterium sp.]|nr:glycosyltransferase family 2 protein [Solobacterium sp.]
MNNVILSVVVPVYNEEGNIESLYKDIVQVLDTFFAGEGNPSSRYEIIMVNDGSTDRTTQILSTLPGIVNVRLERNYGQTAAMDCGFHLAQGKYIAALDGDGQNDPADIPAMLEYLEKNNYDVVSGWRKNRQDKTYRKIMTLGAYCLRQLLLHDGIHDSGCTLKIYRRECFDHIHLTSGQHRLIPAVLKKHGYWIGEYPVNHKARRTGESKYQFNRVFQGFSDTVKLSFYTPGQKKDTTDTTVYTIAEVIRQ